MEIVSFSVRNYRNQLRKCAKNSINAEAINAAKKLPDILNLVNITKYIKALMLDIIQILKISFLFSFAKIHNTIIKNTRQIIDILEYEANIPNIWKKIHIPYDFFNFRFLSSFK